MPDSPRALLPEEHSSAIALINLALRPAGPSSILREYPLVLGSENLHNMRVIVHQGRVVSHAAVYFSRLRTGNIVFRVGGIGSVATHPEYRGRGLAGAVIQDCLKLMREAGCHLSVLWTQRHSFYRKLGFDLAGSEYLYRLHRSISSVRRGCTIVPYSPEHLPGIIRIHEREALRTERTHREYAAYFSLPKTNILVSLREGAVSAYAVMGKGEDFRNCIHDWGGDAGDLLCVMHELAASTGRNEAVILTPAGDNEFVRLLDKMHLPRMFEHLAMMRVVDPEKLSFLLNAHLFSERERSFRIVSEEGHTVIQLESHRAVLEDEGMLVRLIFGHERPSHLLNGASAEMLDVLERAFPIPIFIWGLDSV